MTLDRCEIYTERKGLIAKYVPEEVQAIHSRVISELKQSRLAERALQSGSNAPEFELPDHNGEPVRSSELLQGGRLVICFFRGRWCPFMADQHKLGFPLLSDIGNKVARQFGLVYRVPEYQQEIVNGEDSWGLPIPATYVLDNDHTVIYSAVNPDYTDRPEPTGIVQ